MVAVDFNLVIGGPFSSRCCSQLHWVLKEQPAVVEQVDERIVLPIEFGQAVSWHVVGVTVH